MATTPLRGIECLDHILIPANKADLLDAIKTIATRRQDLNIGKSIISIEHKLNVAMYQAALIYELNPNHFALFEMFRDPASREIEFSNLSYKICSYSIGDIDEYLLILAFFIETLAATIFSLFDISGSLINQLYMLNVSEEKVSFRNVLFELQMQDNIALNDNVLRLLFSYSPYKRTEKYKDVVPLRNITWLKAITEIRHRTTHRPITEICDVKRRGDVYALHSQEAPQAEFFLNRSIEPNKELRDFAREVFEGIEEFVEDLYFYLTKAAQRSADLPIDSIV